MDAAASTASGTAASAGQQPQKRKAGKAAYYAKRQKTSGMSALRPGVSGFLVTCASHFENKCVRDIHRLLDDLLPKEGDKDDHEGEAKNSIAESLQQELGQLKASGGNKDRERLETSCKGVVFVKVAEDVDPTEIGERVFSLINSEERPHSVKSRFIQRFIPVQTTCPAHVENLEKALQKLSDTIQKRYPKGSKFGVVCKIRHNDKLKRDDIIHPIAKIAAHGDRYAVDLDKPDFAVVVEIVRNVACLSVLPKFKQFHKYNLQQASRTTRPKEQAGSAAKLSTAKELTEDKASND